jgi:LacI family transcriptional regulator
VLKKNDVPFVIIDRSIAVVVVAEAAQRSLDIPRELALGCFDDIEHASRFLPFLTVMAQPAETFGTIATQLLLDRLAGRVPERRRIVVLPADFIVRESCGAPVPVDDAAA